MKLEIVASQLEALGNTVRLRIYRLLVRAGPKGQPVGSVQDKMDIPGSTLSHHLKKLVDTGLASQERQGTTLICRAEYPAMTALIGYLSDECCADSGCAPSACAPAEPESKETVEAEVGRG